MRECRLVLLAGGRGAKGCFYPAPYVDQGREGWNFVGEICSVLHHFEMALNEDLFDVESKVQGWARGCENFVRQVEA